MRMQPLGTTQDLRVTALALLLGGIALGGCDYSSPLPTSPSPAPQSTPAVPPVQAGDTGGTISGNHGHRAIVTAEQLKKSAAIQLDITGTADHSHTLDLSAEEVALLNAGGGMQKRSSYDSGHDHLVTFLGYWDY